MYVCIEVCRYVSRYLGMYRGPPCFFHLIKNNPKTNHIQISNFQSKQLSNLKQINGLLAQSVERWSNKPTVMSSNLIESTTFSYL